LCALPTVAVMIWTVAFVAIIVIWRVYSTPDELV
jgi:hypothetical protein